MGTKPPRPKAVTLSQRFSSILWRATIPRIGIKKPKSRKAFGIKGFIFV